MTSSVAVSRGTAMNFPILRNAVNFTTSSANISLQKHPIRGVIYFHYSDQALGSANGRFWLESRHEQDVFPPYKTHTHTQDLGPSHWVSGRYPWMQSRWGVQPTTRAHLVPRLRIHGATPHSPASLWHAHEQFYLYI